MYLSMGNVLTNPAVGLLFIDFERRAACEWAADVLPVNDPARPAQP
jgi:hypothetical protein